MIAVEAARMYPDATESFVMQDTVEEGEETALVGQGLAPVMEAGFERLPVILEKRGAILPRRATAGSAGYDLCPVDDVRLSKGCFTKVETGIRIAIPRGYA